MALSRSYTKIHSSFARFTNRWIEARGANNQDIDAILLQPGFTPTGNAYLSIRGPKLDRVFDRNSESPGSLKSPYMLFPIYLYDATKAFLREGSSTLTPSDIKSVKQMVKSTMQVYKLPTPKWLTHS